MHGLKMLQEEILTNILKLKVTLTDIDQGIYMMEKRLCQNSVLIVLDDVDHLEMLVGSHTWFGIGSRIIFTTRNKDLANTPRFLTHNVMMLDVEEAIELFRRHAFGKSKHVQGLEDVSQNIVSKFGSTWQRHECVDEYLGKTSMNESKDIPRLVDQISYELLSLMKRTEVSAHETSSDTYLIGINTRDQRLKSLLEVGSGGVRIVGISGMWGCGKSTLASSIYDEISHEFEEAIENFSRCAFGKSKPVQGFEEVSVHMVSKFGGHPSALISMGSFLHGKDMSEWMSILDRLEGIPVDEILKKFKIREKYF
ncbi:hypothetical protein L1987_61899 [Smallanthus sonchifolius]|uniref:Uncharacterized protein n=1 Tax=Smallanthus sonchifolius TaxID=185202 RepID=A0ACB9C8W1_9ASTR|nr:hypothetical protein L1987_61899 [Smallanthus sonchifolius]